MGTDKVEVGDAEFCGEDGRAYVDDEEDDDDEAEIREEEAESAREALGKLPSFCFTDGSRDALTEEGWKEYLKAVKVREREGVCSSSLSV
jgi:hypothetical protein